MQQKLPGLRWDGPAAYMTIGYGPTAMSIVEGEVFCKKEFLLGDSAFCASSVVVPAFKKSPNANLSETRTYFN